LTHDEAKRLNISTAELAGVARKEDLRPAEVICRRLLAADSGYPCRIAEKLHEKGIDVKPPTLAKYLNEFRRGKERKKDTAPLPKKTAPVAQPDRLTTVSRGGFAITPDTPLEDL
jgi:hypothetical protein